MRFHLDQYAILELLIVERYSIAIPEINTAISFNVLTMESMNAIGLILEPYN